MFPGTFGMHGDLEVRGHSGLTWQVGSLPMHAWTLILLLPCDHFAHTGGVTLLFLYPSFLAHPCGGAKFEHLAFPPSMISTFSFLLIFYLLPFSFISLPLLSFIFLLSLSLVIINSSTANSLEQEPLCTRTVCFVRWFQQSDTYFKV